MSLTILEQKNNYEAGRRRMKHWRTLVTALACIVVFCTTYALILPAITMENTAYCGYEEHAHNEECYITQLICEKTDEIIEGHEHTEECYKQQKEQICEKNEIAAHVHLDECKSVEVTVGCGLEEIEGHIHVDSCFVQEQIKQCELEESEEHIHEDACYTIQEIKICELEEVEGHTHTEECNVENTIYICGLEETEGHAHVESCYVISEVLDCDLETEDTILEHVHTEECYEEVFACERPEHAHEKMCYSNPSADVETAEDWEVTLPTELTGVWAEDLLAVAESQLGYKESTKNYIIDESGEVKGYSRYGAWYGSPYGDWCAMFVSFCLEYAGIPQEMMPQEAACQKWIEQISGEEFQRYRIAGEYEPVTGDLIFFNNDAEEDSDHVGIVVAVMDAEEENGKQIQVIEGNQGDEVTYKTYSLSDPTIMGYGILQSGSEEVPQEIETEAPVKLALTKSPDEYAPEGIELTGVWADDVTAIANSQVGYSEVHSLSKFDQWAGGDGTNYWNVNFVNYCLSYAGVDSDIIPWNISYSFEQWRAVLEEKGIYKDYVENQIKPGDIVFVQGWNAGQNYNVGICAEVSGTSLQLIFGDMDGNTRVVKEQFWADWTGRILGHVSLSENLSTTVDGVLEAGVGYNQGILPPDTSLVVELIDEHEGYRQFIEDYLKPAGSQICEDYYLNIYFTKDGAKIEPEGSLNIEIDFITPLNPGKSTQENAGALQWIYGKIKDEAIDSALGELQTEQDANDCITKVRVQYDGAATTYALAAAQETNVELSVQKEIETGTISVTAIGNTTVLSENMKLDIQFINKNTNDWIDCIRNTYQTEKELVSANFFFEILIKDAEGRPVELPEGAKVLITMQFAPALSSALQDGSSARSGSWRLHTIEAGNSVSLNQIEAKTTIAKEVSLEAVTFDYDKNVPYALLAIVINPAYTETVTTYEQLKEILEKEESVSQIQLGADLTIPSEGGFTITGNQKVFLDLNGYDISTDSTLFTIKENAEVSLIDTKQAAESTEIIADMNLRADEDGDSETQLAANRANVGMLASYDETTEKLTYYVTKTQITDQSVGATKETLIKHTVELKGTIKGGSEPVIRVEGGTFHLENGAITNCTNTAILQSGGTLNLTGGYICNNHKTSGDGGAIHSTGDSSLLIDGTVIAANSSKEDGGAICIDGSSFTLTSGVVSGNSAASSGGGIFVTGKTAVNINGGYITNNRADTTEYRGGGGGIFTNAQAAIRLTGGVITGNYAESGGGGIRTFADRFWMTGGFINSNYANLSEGGGLSINEYGTGEILAGYINNNVSNTHQHWGGGGFFSANDSTVYITRIVVTNNDAGGYGGGVAGCSTGRAFVYEEDGGIIYNNTAVDRDSNQPHVSGGESTKAEDHLYPTSAFRLNGYEDYFCAFNSIISGTILGGGSANWTGTVDGLPVAVAKNEVVSSTYLMGLVSNPSPSDIEKALDNAKVYVNGNDSYTHGGGMLGNGYLVIGKTESVEVYSRLRIDASKEMTGAELQDEQFKFVIEDLHTGFVVATGTNDEEGNITFDHMLPFKETGIYEYLIYEDHNSENGEYAGILMDTTKYKVTVTVGKISEQLERTIEKERYVITSIVVAKKNEGDWETVQTIESPDNPDNKPVVLTLTKGASFHNVVTEYTTFSVVKRWVGNAEENAVQVQLLRDGEAFGSPVELSAANHWTYKWENELPLYSMNWETEEKIFHTYSVEELNVPEGYQVSYDYFNTTESDAVWIPYTNGTLELEKDYIIVAPDGEHVLYLSDMRSDLMITEQDKASAVKQTEPIYISGQEHQDYYYDGTILLGSVYRAQNSNGIRLNHPGAGYRTLAVPQDGSGFNLQSSWWPLRNLYVGNVQVCTSSVDDQRNYMIVFENGKFDAVPYDPNNTNAAKLYTLAYTDLTNETIFTVTNTKIEENILYKLDITKVSADNHEVLLTGAEFALYPADEKGNADLGYQAVFAKTVEGAYRYLGFQYVESVNPAEIVTAVTARGGKLVISELPKGKYVLVETKAPNGYEVAEPILLIFGEDLPSTTYRITIEDQVEQHESYILPETGGAGRTQDRLTGIGLIGVALLLHIYRKKLNLRRKHT